MLKQTTKPAGNWVLIQLIGTRSNRSAIGAKVRLTAGGTIQTEEVRSGGAYISQSDLRLHFGLGDSQRIDRLEILWPSGLREMKSNLSVNRLLLMVEPAAGRTPGFK